MKKILLLIGLITFLMPMVVIANENLKGMNIFCEVKKKEARFIEFMFDWNKTYNESSMVYFYSRRDNGVKRSMQRYHTTPKNIFIGRGEYIDQLIYLIDRDTLDIKFLFEKESHYYPGKEFIDGEKCEIYYGLDKGKLKIENMFNKYK